MNIRVIYKTLIIYGISKSLKNFTESIKDEEKKDQSGENVIIQIPRNLKIITAEDSGTKENDESKYKSIRVGRQFKYVMNPNSKCIRIECEVKESQSDDVIVWKHNQSKHGNNYPTSILFDPSYRIITVYLGDNWIYNYNFDYFNSKFKLESSITPYKEEEQPSEIQITTVDESGSSKINDITKYELIKGDEVFYFDFIDKSKCIELKYKGNKVWNHNLHIKKDEYPKTIILNRQSNQITVIFKEFYLLYKYNDQETKLVSKTNTKKISENDLVIVTSDDEYETNRKEGDLSKYEVERRGSEVEYKIKEGSKCIQIKYKEKIIWNYKEDNKNGFPKSIVLDKNTEVIFVEFNDNTYSVYNNNNNQFELNYNKKLEEFPESYIKIMTSDDPQGNNSVENDPNKYQIKKYVYGYEYELKEGTICTEVICKEKTVWKYNPENPEEKFPKKITLNKFICKDGLISILFEDKDIDYLYIHNRWIIYFQNKRKLRNREITTTIKEPVEKKPTKPDYDRELVTKPVEISKKKRQTIVYLLVALFVLIILGLGLYWFRRN